ncbi:MAG: PepSY domain-containing protein [Rhodanobacteraceae bacterium]|nr:MAG: PepSY domain-containing protein [Rhodanobacteraceae bacterium]
MGYIQQPHTLWWRKALFQVHLWIGVCIGLYVIAICITGSVLVFEQNLLNDRPSLPQSPTHAAPDWQQLVRTAIQGNPGSTLAYIDMRSSNRRIVPIGLDANGRTLVVYMDAYTDRIVKQEDLGRKHWFVEFALSLHTQLALGARGAIANGIGGALLFLMALLGIVLWWPGIRIWKRALKINWRARWAGLNFDVHRTFGFWCFLLIAMWGITGVYFIFPKAVQGAISAFSSTASLKEVPSNWKPGDRVLPVSDFIRRAQALYPRDHLAYAYMDVGRPHGEVQIYMSPNPSVPMELLEDEVVFNPASGAMLMNTSSARWTTGERFALGVYSAHFGDFGGLPLQILWAILGLVPVVLVITAYTMWWNRSLKKKWAKLSTRRNVYASSQ